MYNRFAPHIGLGQLEKRQIAERRLGQLPAL
jgi:hypothetical protein